MPTHYGIVIYIYHGSISIKTKFVHLYTHIYIFVYVGLSSDEARIHNVYMRIWTHAGHNMGPSKVISSETDFVYICNYICCTLVGSTIMGFH